MGFSGLPSGVILPRVTSFYLQNIDYTDLTSFDYLHNFPGLHNISIENAPNLNDFSSLYSYAPAQNISWFAISLQNVGTNHEDVSLNLESLFTGNILSLSSLYLNKVNVDFTGLTGQGSANTLNYLSLIDMNLSDFSTLDIFEILYHLALTDNKFTSIDGIEDIIYSSDTEIYLNNTKHMSSNNAIKDITPLEEINSSIRYKFSAENQFIVTDEPINYQANFTMKNAVKVGKLNLISSITAPEGATYTVVHNEEDDTISWVNIPANVTETTYNFDYYTAGANNLILGRASTFSAPQPQPPLPLGTIIFNGTITFPVEAGSPVPKTFDVIYNANDGTVTPVTQVDSNGPYAENALVTVLDNGDTNFTRSGYTLIGWNPIQADANSGIIDALYNPNENFLMPNEDFILYAVWQVVTPPVDPTPEIPTSEIPTPELLPEPIPETESVPATNPHISPQTGDTANTIFFFITLLISAIGIAMLTICNCRKKRKI